MAVDSNGRNFYWDSIQTLLRTVHPSLTTKRRDHFDESDFSSESVQLLGAVSILGQLCGLIFGEQPSRKLLQCRALLVLGGCTLGVGRALPFISYPRV
jgi:hypothetical protein